ncbi:hypothetical protein CROQUDRAFT_54545 [Cronartium quercuum f. sp. fusiforme G11]|uniref:BAR-domain-containing protein n=1 Tax=Cronartium quercuum f. sp. fusiforme G11 TaxID=708437 RepID=A0A9P6T572_9BASI|nr:hypothetical protein CROQUDRAFT_54545 [Cronartium quercuum f. sp. fusiforme G11]
MKVNKRIGKLKQWTGEKLGGQQKTELSEDFQSLEQDVDLRKAGVDRLYSVSKEYSKHLTKKIEAEGTDTGKVLPVDALGLVFANHGDEFGNDSAFGQALVAFGKAQQQLANVTANYTEHLNSGWLTSLEKSIAQMAEYTAQRKKLDSRRLTYDAMLAKVQKSKKEKRDLEDDLRVAKNRYEETSEEVQERAVAIQDAESDQLASLTKLLDIESAWIDEQKRIMDDLKRHWVDQNALKSSSRKKVTAHTFGVESTTTSKPSIKAKTGLTARSATRNGRNLTASSDREDEDYQESEELEEPEEEEDYDPSPRRSKPVSKPRSVPVTRESSLKEKPNASRFGGVRIPGLPGGTPASNYSDESASPTTHESPVLRTSVQRQQHQQPTSPGLRRSLTAPPKSAKILKAKWAYSATAGDELQLGVGDRVRVTSEVNQEWFIGTNESTGETGMFPAAYCVPDETSSLTASHKFIMPEPSDTFADPSEEDDEERSEEDESDRAALRPSRNIPPSSQRDQPHRVSSFGKLHSMPPSSTTGKRAPPPPPTRRATTATVRPPGNTTAHSALSSSTGGPQEVNDQPEAFGSVSELKKRLGMHR